MSNTPTNAPDWRGNIEDAAVIYNLLKDKHSSEVGMPAWVLFNKVVRYLEIYAPERMDNKKRSKTAIEWFSTIKDEDIKRRAILNTSKEKSTFVHENLLDALAYSFKWAETTEGWIYWNDVSYKISNNEL